MDHPDNPVDFPLESPGKLIASFFWHRDQQHLLLRVAGANGGLAISPDELKEIIVLCRDRLLPLRSPRMTAVTDQVMAEIRDNQKELMNYASRPDVGVPYGKTQTLVRACVLIALNQLEES